MNTTESLAPEIELLVRRWHLPKERVLAVQKLIEAQNEGDTACRLEPGSPLDPYGWGAAALASAQSAGPGKTPPKPLVLRTHQGKPHLQSWRFFQAEQAIARDLLTRASLSAPTLAQTPAQLLANLKDPAINELQAQAITCALTHKLALITGGPGTGKTHTLARLLALLVASQTGPHPLVIKLAAPTGKAAERMKEAIENAAEKLPSTVGEGIADKLKAAASGASTVHKLLGFNPATGHCALNAKTPLSCDVLIIDECSMVDTLMWQALLSALPQSSRLILLGDPNQLESVSAGDVLGSLVRQARQSKPLASVWVELTESHRFKHRPGIGALAKAIVNLRPDDALDLLRAHPSTAARPLDDGLSWLGDHGGRFAWECLPQPVQLAITAVADAPTPEEALTALNRVRLLTAHREYSLGVSGLNQAIENHFSRCSAALSVTGTRKTNRPIIVNKNDADTGLTNGSVGIIMADAQGIYAAYFPSGSKQSPPRRVELGQLPDHGTAWAMTIHRSQGSEFDHVVVMLPPDDSPLATRELIYTAITRAKDWVHVWGTEATVRKALTKGSLRCTLLESHLAGALS